jgi:hypothetical protein
MIHQNILSFTDVYDSNNILKLVQWVLIILIINKLSDQIPVTGVEAGFDEVERSEMVEDRVNVQLNWIL